MAAPVHASKEYVQYFFTDEVLATPRPTEWEIALHTASPGTGDLAEVTELGYTRVDVAFEAYIQPVEGKYWEAQSVADVVFPAGQPGGPYTVTHYTIRDKTSGECLAIAQLAVPIPVREGTVVTFPANYIKVRGV